jgi:methyl-accepting chemotaxis protein
MPFNVELLRSSFDAIAPSAEELTRKFYERLFTRYPEVKPLFEGVDLPEQRRKLVQSLSVIIRSLTRPEALQKYLHDLGARHVEYGAQPEHYPLVAGVLLEVMAEIAGPAWTPDVARAWTDGLNAVAELMLAGAEQLQPAAVDANADQIIAASPRNAFEAKPVAASSPRSSFTADPARAAGRPISQENVPMSPETLAPSSTSAPIADHFYSLVEASPLGQFLVDGAGVVTYLNRKGHELLRQLSGALGFGPEQLVNNSVQRLALAVPELQSKLVAWSPTPVSLQTKLGDQWVEWTVSPLAAAQNQRSSVAVSFNIVTEQATRNARVAQLQSMLDNMPINVMLADNDLVIRYVNPASLEQLSKLQKHLPVPANAIVGQSVDVFHKNPAVQRNILRDPRNLPHRALIQVGPELLDLLVTAVRDDSGKYLGPMVTWEVVTQKKALEERNADLVAQMEAIGRTSAVIEFQLDGTIITANDNFLRVMGYSLEEIRGKHHSIFVDDAYRQSQDYRDLWARLNRGEYVAGDFKRFAKGGREIWIQAAYNPIRDVNGKLVKVVKFATDITQAVLARNEMVRIQNMMDNLPINVILANRSGDLMYLNPAAIKTLKRIEHLLPRPVDQLKGQSMDIFHKHPEMQRRIISDPKNLPHKARIQLGDQHLDLMVSAITDKDGNYVGPMLTWAIITEQVKLADDFERDVKSVAQIVTAAATEMQAGSKSLAAASEETARQAQVVAAASEEATRNVETVSASAEELSKSISEIARHVQEASRMTAVAVRDADKTNETIKHLGESSNQIGEVVKVITSIAQQTNLLALNATIEAARAGEAGKGFAVVANEVKELARQTAKATEEISQKISAIQNATGTAVAAIGAIGDSIRRINEISTTIASAVEEQTAATNEISRNVSEAAKGTAEVSSNIAGVSQAADEGGRGASDILAAAEGLAQESLRLDQVTTNFLKRMRSM